MAEQEIYQKISDLYNSDKSKNFITHLLRAFFPVHKSDYLWDEPKQEIKCCITGVPLTSKQGAFNVMQ